MFFCDVSVLANVLVILNHACCLQVYRVYSNNQEFENVRLSESLSFLEDGKVSVFVPGTFFEGFVL